MTPLNLAVTFALLSLLFAGINDVVFKRYSSKNRSRGMYVFGIGLVWILLQAMLMHNNGERLVTDRNTIFFGVAAGGMVTLSNLLLLECFTHLDVSLGSTIYRLNTIGVVILSYTFLAEPLGAVKLLGIVSGVVAVLFLFQRPDSVAGKRVFGSFFWIAVLASLLRASFGVTSKAGLAAGASRSTMMILFALSWIVGGLCYAWLRESGVKITARQAVYAVVSGALVFLIVNCLVTGLEYGDASIVVPIANMSFVVAFGTSVALRMESFSPRKGVAVAFAGFDRKLLGKLSSCAWRCIKTEVRRLLGRDDVVPGMIAAIQTHGTLLHWHPHFHVLVTCGAFAGG